MKDNALVAPKVNDLYNQKSEHIIEKFTRMFRLNLKAVVAGAILGLIGFSLLKLPILGVGLALVLTVIAVVNQRLLKGLETIDKSACSYDYLKAFDSWMRNQIAINGRMAKFYYPAIFLSMVLGFWLSPHGPRIYQGLFGEAQSGVLVNGVPVFMLIPIAVATFALWLFGDRIYQWDLSVVYGRVLKKLDEILADMEELRAE